MQSAYTDWKKNTTDRQTTSHKHPGISILGLRTGEIIGKSQRAQEKFNSREATVYFFCVAARNETPFTWAVQRIGGMRELSLGNSGHNVEFGTTMKTTGRLWFSKFPHPFKRLTFKVFKDRG
jgi:hypothetical protein